MWHELQNPGCPVTSIAVTLNTPTPASTTAIRAGQFSRPKVRIASLGACTMYLAILPIISFSWEDAGWMAERG